MKGLVQKLSGEDVAMAFPYIRIYSEIARFFLDAMYRAPAIYTTLGFLSAISLNEAAQS